MAWSPNRAPSTGDNIDREDGRVCRVKRYIPIAPLNPTSRGGTPRYGPLGALSLPPTQVGKVNENPPVETFCGEVLPPRIISMTIWWPQVSVKQMSCEACQQGLVAPPPVVAPPRRR